MLSCPIDIDISSTCLHIRSFLGINSSQQRKETDRKGGGGNDKDEENKDTKVRVRLDSDPAASTTTVATGISPTGVIASDSQIPNSALETEIRKIATTMSSNDDVDALSNNSGNDEGNPQIVSNVAKMKSAPSDTGATDGTDTDTDVNHQLTPGVAKKRRVSFMTGFAKAIHEIPDRNDYIEKNIKDDLFYGDSDYERFRASEQKRYDKMVSKKLQKMVMEKMQPSINEAVANGATLEDIEGMVPKTHDEMVAYMGGKEAIRKLMKASSFTKPKSEERKEKIIRSSRCDTAKGTVDTCTLSVSNDSNQNEIEIESETLSDKEVVEMLSPNSRKRTIRASRSSIEIRPGKKGLLSLSDVEADAVAASEELMGMIVEEGVEVEDKKKGV